MGQGCRFRVLSALVIDAGHDDDERSKRTIQTKNKRTAKARAQQIAPNCAREKTRMKRREGKYQEGEPRRGQPEMKKQKKPE